MDVGFHLSSEELHPSLMPDLARKAEEAGFAFITISDHYHPWLDGQGHSPFAWSVLGAIAAVTERIELATGVTCPIIRYHPAIIAQAAATMAAMMPGRFFLGVGTGEALNEHILGDRWPSSGVRREMLEEAVEVIRLLWTRRVATALRPSLHDRAGELFTSPDEPPPIIVSGFGPHSIELAARIGDGYITTAPDAEAVSRYREAGGSGPVDGKMDVARCDGEAEARRLALETWPNSALEGEVAQVLPLPAHFEAASAKVSEEDVAEKIRACRIPRRTSIGCESTTRRASTASPCSRSGSSRTGCLDLYADSVLPAVGRASAGRR